MHVVQGRLSGRFASRKRAADAARRVAKDLLELSGMDSELARIDAPATGEEPSRLRILFVDDEDVVRDLTAKLLDGFGYDVVEATDGEDAIEKLRGSTGFDAIITDLRMPKMNGVALLEIIHDSYPELSGRAIVMSGYVDSSMMLPPHFVMLRKPCDSSDLLDALYACTVKQRPH
jgi:CheY-like chemotaxis protein